MTCGFWVPRLLTIGRFVMQGNVDEWNEAHRMILTHKISNNQVKVSPLPPFPAVQLSSMVPFIRYRVSGLPFAFRVSFPWMLDTDWSSAVSWQVPKMRVQMSKMQLWQRIAQGGVLWITSGKAWPKALSGLIQTLFLNSRVLTWWKLGGWGYALGETHWNSRIINLTPYTSIPWFRVGRAFEELSSTRLCHGVLDVVAYVRRYERT